MDMRIGNRTTSGIVMVKLDQNGFVADPAQNQANYNDALRVIDAKGDSYLASKPGLINRDKMATGRGDTVTIGGQTYKADANINCVDTTSEKLGRTAGQAANGVQRAAISTLGLGYRAFRAVVGD